MATVADIIRIMEKLAPPGLAESWDSVGLQIGSRDWPVHTIQVALDPLFEVIREACRQQVSMLITHHPLIFKPITSLDFNSPLGSALLAAAQSRLSIYTAHTNLDKAHQGTNDLIADRIGMKQRRPLTDPVTQRVAKLVVFVPVSHEDRILKALAETRAGLIGPYTACSFRNPGIGSFFPLESARPFIGETGRISQVEEIRIETLVETRDLADVVSHIRRHHPYETMAYDVYPLDPVPDGQGMGRVGDLETPARLIDLAESLQASLNIAVVKTVGDPNRILRSAAVCTGSGSSLLKTFLSSGADVYISGDLHYHDARTVQEQGRALIDIGHFGSEHPIVSVLAARIQQNLESEDLPVTVQTCEFETDPFDYRCLAAIHRKTAGTGSGKEEG
jgi:dinuclear metal center YbgI/SA1388 family protein